MVLLKRFVYSTVLTAASVGRIKLLVDRAFECFYAFEYSYNLTFPCAASLCAILLLSAEGAFHLWVFVA